MVFEIGGFEAEFESLAALPADHMTDDHAIPVTFEGVFPASFMQLYTSAETFAEFIEARGLAARLSVAKGWFLLNIRIMIGTDCLIRTYDCQHCYLRCSSPIKCNPLL